MKELEESIASFLDTIGGIIWGPFVLIPLLAITGLLLTVRLRGIQFTKLGPALRLGLKDRKDADADDGDVSQFQALTTALAATVGTGNIVGVATAIALGGPGAVFWMWVTGILGMASKYSEAFLAVRYRTKDDAGEVSGGPQYYLERGITIKVGGISIGKVLAISFAVFAVIASFGIGNMTQANAIARNVGSSWGIDTWIIGLVLMLGAFAVLIGGIKSIGKVTSALVPIMILLYVVASIWILIVNIGNLPSAFGLIFTDAFTGTAATGGFIGATIAQAIRFGMARGIFSNESGMGSAAIAAAAAKTTHPVRQGLVSMTQTFIDTIIVVTCTALVLITTGAWAVSEDDAAYATGEGFSTGLPGEWGHWIVTIALALFAFSTLLGWCYYGERCVERLVGRRGVMPYRVIFCLIVYVGATTSLSLVWSFADVMNGLMALPNLIGLIVMSGLIARETRHYLKNDPNLRATKAEVDAFMEGHDGGIDTYEKTGR
ncbi:alanine/glycine:cation symporter family protein [Flaviflexus equikiangi]|uniref:alanine/glycine:cation symporter family protein n=1 Tax=Flaviflexus equikiangi TaxID=2758573 RepID=UPI001C710071|nr:sodium:alanine symporter family protein [Flaviflexus equikiangi]